LLLTHTRTTHTPANSTALAIKGLANLEDLMPTKIMMVNLADSLPISDIF